jgi:hypothetical protein
MMSRPQDHEDHVDATEDDGSATLQPEDGGAAPQSPLDSTGD